MIYPRFVDHVGFRVGDLGKTERFYTILLGEPSHRTEDSVMYEVGDARLFFSACDLDNPRVYEKEEIGLNHLAFGVRTLEELETVREQLDGAAIVHSGIHIDRYGRREFIWLDDPDGMRIEFYLRPLS
jgi:glyoxylase I family protein